MLGNRYVRIVVILGMVAIMCGTVGADMGIVAGTRVTSGVEAPACTAPCECMSESTAVMQWGADGYEMCSKTICGQSADAMVQYYCIHQFGGSVAAAVTTAPSMVPASAAIPATPAAATTPQESPQGMVGLAAIGIALLAAPRAGRK